MTRQQKYPDTRVFHYYNANPKNKITGDCAFRAIATALEQTWEQTVREMCEMSCKTGYAINDKKGVEHYLKSKGWKKHAQPRKEDNTKYTGAEFCREAQEYTFNYPDRIIANIGGHHMVAIIYGKVWDIWDSTDRSIGNYWTKE